MIINETGKITLKLIKSFGEYRLQAVLLFPQIKTQNDGKIMQFRKVKKEALCFTDPLEIAQA